MYCLRTLELGFGPFHSNAKTNKRVHAFEELGVIERGTER